LPEEYSAREASHYCAVIPVQGSTATMTGHHDRTDLGTMKAATPLVMVLKAIGRAPQKRDWLGWLNNFGMVAEKRMKRPSISRLNTANSKALKLHTAKPISDWPVKSVKIKQLHEMHISL